MQSNVVQFSGKAASVHRITVASLPLLLSSLALLMPMIAPRTARAAACPTFITASEVGYYYRQQSFVSHTSVSGLAAGGSYGVEYRNYVVFDIPVIPTNLISAELWISNVSVTTQDGSEVYELSEVTNTLDIIHAYGITESNVFNDLGDGAFYGSTSFTPLD